MRRRVGKHALDHVERDVDVPHGVLERVKSRKVLHRLSSA